MNDIAIQVASAANACYSYYVGKNPSSDVMNKIVAIVAESGESEFSEEYLVCKRMPESLRT